MTVKPGLPITCKDRKHMFASMFFKLSAYVLVFIVVMIAGIHISQEMFAIDMLTALKPSFEHGGKHVLLLSRLYLDGNQA